MELVTRLFLVRPPCFQVQNSRDLERSDGPPTIDPEALIAMSPQVEQLGRRKLAALVGCAQVEGGRTGLEAFAALVNTTLRIEPGLAPRHGEILAVFQARVLQVLDQLSREFMHSEVLVVLHADGIRAALARALCISDDHVFAPEPGQAIALDWAHPDAREFQHALIGMAIDWEVAPAANKVHRFPGGASVLPRPS